MTRFCRPYPGLVGPQYWLPPEPFEYAWADLVGCNNLRCARCEQAVSAEVLPDGRARRYTCGCRQRDEYAVYRIGADPEDLYPAEITGWSCGGHPDFVLPTTLDGIGLDAGTAWDTVAIRVSLEPPFEPPGVELFALWITRLYRLLLDADRPPLSRAVARLFDAEDARLVRAAYDFFVNEPDASGVERLAGSVTERREWLAATADPRWPTSPLLDGAALALQLRLRRVDRGGAPIDRPALDVVEELALVGVGTAGLPLVLHQYDPEWFCAHAGPLARVKPRWVSIIVSALVEASAERRERAIRDVARAAPELAREAIEQHLPEPERSRLLAATRTTG